MLVRFLSGFLARRPFPQRRPRCLVVALVLPAALALAGGCAGSNPAGSDPPASAPPAPEAGPLEMAKAYAAERSGDALLVWQRGDLVVEDYTNGHRAGDPHRLASGTKTFAGAMALAAAEDGLLALDEPVAASVPAWGEDPQKAKATLRHLLQLTSGIETGIGRAPSFEAALEKPLVHAPGEGFRYGPVAFQAFGAVLQRKLDGEAPEAYLQRRILEPIGATATWARAGDDVNLGAGARMTARSWLRFGRLLLGNGTFEGRAVLSGDVLEPLTAPTSAAPGYGLSVWLNAPVDPGASFFDHTPPDLAPDGPAGMIYAEGPNDLFMAAGLGNQRLYVIPSREMVVVRFGRRDPSWHDGEFLARLLDGAACEASAGAQARSARAREQQVSALARRQMAALDSALALTDEQASAIRPIVERRTEALLEVRQRRASGEPLGRREKRRMLRSLRRTMKRTDEDIRSHLTPEQRRAYEALREKQREALRSRRSE